MEKIVMFFCNLLEALFKMVMSVLLFALVVFLIIFFASQLSYNCIEIAEATSCFIVFQ